MKRSMIVCLTCLGLVLGLAAVPQTASAGAPQPINSDEAADYTIQAEAAAGSLVTVGGANSDVAAAFIIVGAVFLLCGGVIIVI
jgi:hypothetical protein